MTIGNNRRLQSDGRRMQSEEDRYARAVVTSLKPGVTVGIEQVTVNLEGLPNVNVVISFPADQRAAAEACKAAVESPDFKNSMEGETDLSVTVGEVSLGIVVFPSPPPLPPPLPKPEPDPTKPPVSTIDTRSEINTGVDVDDDDGSGLSGGAIAGIVIGSLLAVALVALVVFLTRLFMRYTRANKTIKERLDAYDDHQNAGAKSGSNVSGKLPARGASTEDVVLQEGVTQAQGQLDEANLPSANASFLPHKVGGSNANDTKPSTQNEAEKAPISEEV